MNRVITSYEKNVKESEKKVAFCGIKSLAKISAFPCEHTVGYIAQNKAHKFVHNTALEMKTIY